MMDGVGEACAVGCDEVDGPALLCKTSADGVGELADRGEVVGVVEENEKGQTLLSQLLAVFKSDLSNQRVAEVAGPGEQRLVLQRPGIVNNVQTRLKRDLGPARPGKLRVGVRDKQALVTQRLGHGAKDGQGCGTGAGEAAGDGLVCLLVVDGIGELLIALDCVHRVLHQLADVCFDGRGGPLATILVLQHRALAKDLQGGVLVDVKTLAQTHRVVGFAVHTRQAGIDTVSQEHGSLLISRAQLLAEAAPVGVKVDHHHIVLIHKMIQRLIRQLRGLPLGPHKSEKRQRKQKLESLHLCRFLPGEVGLSRIWRPQWARSRLCGRASCTSVASLFAHGVHASSSSRLMAPCAGTTRARRQQPAICL
eukprot:m.142613 g.142613  ORF g.142613 m.142613 type:complete len:365 (-) comp14974_c15_seq10:750-1844(-)